MIKAQKKLEQDILARLEERKNLDEAQKTYVLGLIDAYQIAFMQFYDNDKTRSWASLLFYEED